ncbi:MAG: hypothetical protein HZLCBSQH_002007 [Candidatus Fervidibacterota bacterium]
MDRSEPLRVEREPLLHFLQQHQCRNSDEVERHKGEDVGFALHLRCRVNAAEAVEEMFQPTEQPSPRRRLPVSHLGKVFAERFGKDESDRQQCRQFQPTHGNSLTSVGHQGAE